MPKTLMQSLASQLQKERTRLENELRGVTAALTAFSKVYVQGNKSKPVTATRKKRTVSAAARRKIAAAQKARWAAWRAKQKKAA